MKKSMKLLTVTMVLAIVISFGSVAYASSLTEASTSEQNSTQYSVEEILTQALEEENAALAEYAAVADAFDDARPFSNFVRAEENHIAILKQTFEDYGLTLPVNKAVKAAIPESLEAGYDAAIAMEEEMKAMYENFLKVSLPEDVKLVLERLLFSSERHIQALQNVKDGTANCLGRNSNGGFKRGGFGNNRNQRGFGMMGGNGSNCQGNYLGNCLLD